MSKARAWTKGKGGLFTGSRPSSGGGRSSGSPSTYRVTPLANTVRDTSRAAYIGPSGSARSHVAQGRLDRGSARAARRYDRGVPLRGPGIPRGTRYVAPRGASSKAIVAATRVNRQAIGAGYLVSPARKGGS